MGRTLFKWYAIFLVTNTLVVQTLVRRFWPNHSAHTCPSLRRSALQTNTNFRNLQVFFTHLSDFCWISHMILYCSTFQLSALASIIYPLFVTKMACKVTFGDSSFDSYR